MNTKLIPLLLFSLFSLLIQDTFAQCSYNLVNNSSGSSYAYTTMPPVSGSTSITWYIGSTVSGNAPTISFPTSTITVMNTVCAEIIDSGCPQPIVICDTVANCDYQFTHHVSGNTIYLNNTPYVFSPAQISWTVNGNAITGTNDPIYTAPGPGTYVVCMIVVDPGCMPNNTFYQCDTIVIPAVGCNYHFTYTLSGDSIQLNNTPQVQSPATINWTVNGNPITGTNDPLYIAPGPGTYIICMVVVDMNCQLTPTTYVCDTIVIPAVGCNYSFTYSVSGDNIQLLNTPQVQAPATISWTVNGNPITGTNDPLYIAPGPGTYIICMVVVDMNCQLTPTTYVCDTIVIPAVGCNYNFTYSVSGDTIQLLNTPQVQAPATISWTVNGNPITGTNDPLYFAPGPGTYIICMVVVDMSCQLNPTTYICDTITIPQSGCNYSFTYTLTGDTISLVNTPSVSSPATIQWTVNGNTISNTNDPVHVLGAPGVYEVCLLIVNPACTLNNTYFHCDTIYVYGVGNDAEIQGNQHLEIFPNPTAYAIEIKLQVEWIGENTDIEIFDMLGQCLFKLHRPVTQENEHIEIALEGLNSGVYFVQVSGKSTKATGRFQVIR